MLPGTGLVPADPPNTNKKTMIVKLPKKYRDYIIETGEDVYEIMHYVLMRENKMSRDKEHFWAMSLGSSNMILLLELVSLGSHSRSFANPKEVFAFPLQKRAARVILIHNHPGGTLEPSKQDRYITDRLIAAGKIVSLEIPDHMIISEKGYFSFETAGIIGELQAGENFITKEERDILIAYAEEWGLNVGKERGVRKGKKIGIKKGIKIGKKEGLIEGEDKGIKKGEMKKAIAIAKNLMKESLPIELIAKATGLTKKEIEKLRHPS